MAADADGDAARASAARELEFARLYADHDRLLAERGGLDSGELVLRAFQLLHERPHVRERVPARFQHVLVDEYDETNFAQGMLLRLLIEEHRQVTLVGADDSFLEELPEARREGCRAGAQLPLGPPDPPRGGRCGARAEAHRRERRPRALLALPL